MTRIEFFEPMRIPTVTHNDLEPRRGRGGKHYIGKSAALKEAEASWEAHLAKHAPEGPFSGPVYLAIAFNFMSGDRADGSPMDGRPDVDNLLKTVLDAMGRLGWFEVGDQQVTSCFAMKSWSGKAEGISVGMSDEWDGAVSHG